MADQELNASVPATPLTPATPTFPQYDAREMALMRGAYSKLDNMPLSFGIPRYSDQMADADVSKYMSGDLKDVMREVGLTSLDGVAEMSNDELHIENRIVYYALRRFRLSASVFFKFSTAVDGKTVDKQQIPKMLAALIAEYDQSWSNWKMTSDLFGGSLDRSGLWNREGTVATNGDYSTSS